jgi:hypothetical protein
MLVGRLGSGMFFTGRWACSTIRLTLYLTITDFEELFKNMLMKGERNVYYAAENLSMIPINQAG